MATLVFGKESRSLTIGGVRTSVRLEPIFWRALAEIAEEQGRGYGEIINDFETQDLSSKARTCALRCYILETVLKEGSARD